MHNATAILKRKVTEMFKEYRGSEDYRKHPANNYSDDGIIDIFNQAFAEIFEDGYRITKKVNEPKKTETKTNKKKG